MIEIRVRDWQQSRTWYEQFLGVAPTLLDSPHEFALFETPPIRLSIKAGECQRGSTTVVLQVDDLDAERNRLAGFGISPTDAEKMSAEGYRRLKFADLDGQPLILFQWTSGGEK